MSAAVFVIDTPAEHVVFDQAGAAADYLVAHQFADLDREPQWHVQWCLERMEPGGSMDFGDALVTRR